MKNSMHRLVISVVIATGMLLGTLVLTGCASTHDQSGGDHSHHAH